MVGLSLCDFVGTREEKAMMAAYRQQEWPDQYTVNKKELASKEELDRLNKHVTSMAALDFLVCLKSDVFVMTHGGNFAKLVMGARRYMGHLQKSIKPDKGVMSKSFGDPYMGWSTFKEGIIVTHQTRTRLPIETFPSYDIWENPLTPCMCRT
ncbi:protein PECTIC ARABINOGALACTAN SYNTHESIS-RELATED-like [Tasmannia lanceolata]|uniref:protein PECTIC ARABINOGALACTAN SYNTHESIS-RELATED-like n=1 Tax=Tasmannia lanceolata TaxID=3420 RepID=UPI00406324C3